MSQGDAHFFKAEPSSEESTGSAAGRVDVLVLTALQDELEGVLALAEGGRDAWRERRDLGGFRYYQRSFPSARGGQIVIAAAWTGEMGERTAAIRGQQLLAELDPGCLAMCGICAGYREKTALGDVIIADRLYDYDAGKHVAGSGDAAGFFHDVRTFDIEATWKMDAAFLTRELDLAALQNDRPRSKQAQQWWLLQALYDHEAEGKPSPVTHPERARACPGWTAHLKEAVGEGLVKMKGGTLQLTDAGRDKVLEHRLLYPDGLPADPPLRVHVGALATVKAVQEDAALWNKLRRLVRGTLGLEMEGSALGDLAARASKRSILVKAVSDHGDRDKDDSFRTFACRAAAAVMLAFLQKYLEPTPDRPDHDEPRDPHVAPRDRDPDRPGDGFLARVERVARIRHPGADIKRRPAPSPFAGLLEVALQDGPVVDLRVISALEHPVSEALVTRYLSEIEHPYRLENLHVRSILVHGGEEAPAGLVRSAARRGVQLKSFAGYQGLLDFSRYLEWQTQRLDNDPIYPPGLYVDAPARVSLAQGREPRTTENALQDLWDLLNAPDRARFALVLGDFGAGKTFLLHELARRMAREKHPLVPVLVEMRHLEKQRSLKVLLAQHFALADMEQMAGRPFEYMLAEGRVALLFDGFDELALRVTYDRAVEHFETVMAAAQGLAKVVVTSRTQHFLTEDDVRRELGRRAEQVAGYRLFQLEKFGDKQIRRFLGNLIPDEQEAEARYKLLDEVKDLLGLSENPRLLGFIAGIDPAKLREAKQKIGEITAAKLYELLVDQWLDFEHARANPKGTPHGIAREALRKAMTHVALLLWSRPVKSLEIGELPESLVKAVQSPTSAPLERGVVEHLIGSGSLLVRDADGRFSFLHRSVLEWLVAEVAAREVVEKGDAAALAADEMSDLMADFFLSLAGPEQAATWVTRMLQEAAEGHSKKNSLRILHRIHRYEDEEAIGDDEIEVVAGVDLSEQDLSGRDLSHADLRKANLTHANLWGSTLVKARLGGASLVSAQLGRADLSGADLAGANLLGAALSFTRLFNADLTGADLAGANLRGAKLVGAQGVALDGLQRVGAAPPVPGEVVPMWAPASECNAVAWNPCGDLVASGHASGLIVLWDVVSGQPIRTFEGHTSGVMSVAFSHDGTKLASGSSNKTVRLWEVSSGTPLRAFEGHTSGVMSVAFSHDDTKLASGSDDKTVRLWEVSSGTPLRAFEGHASGVRSVAFSHDGTKLASGSDDKTVRLWDVSSGTPLRAFGGHTSGVRSVVFSHDGTKLASGAYDTTVRLWEVSSGTPLRAFEGHTSGVMSVAFNHDGTKLASGSYDTTVRLWDVSSGTPLRAFEGHTSGVMSVAFNHDGTKLASGSYDKTVRLWDVSSGTPLRAFEGHASGVMSVAFSHDGTKLASGAYDTTVRLWDVSSGTPLHAFEGHASGVMSVAFSHDGTKLASGSDDHTVRLWEVSSGTPLRAFAGHTYGVMSVAFSHDGTKLASGSYDKTVRLWEVSSGTPLRTFVGHKNWVMSVAFSHDDTKLVSGSSDHTVRLWEMSSGTPLRAFEGHTSGVMSVAFSHDGTKLASGSSDKTVRLWDVSSGTSLRAFVGHTYGVMSVAFSHDGTKLASGSSDKTVRLWDVASGRRLRVLHGHKMGVTSVAFSSDGRTLASASYDGTLRVWDIATGRCLAILLATREGWAAFTPDGRYKIGGDLAGGFWHVVGLCRFEPGELDPYLPEPLQLPDDASFLALPARGR